MKKLFLTIVCALVCIGASAQLLTSTSVAVKKQKSATSVWFDFGPGFYTGDVADTSLGIDLGLRVNHAFTDAISWDIIKIKAQSDVNNISEMLALQALTGVRYTSPVLFGNSSLYGAVGLGYSYFVDTEDGGFDWDVSVGINLSPRFSVGIGYNSCAVNDATVGYASVRLGLRF